jgi:hypothetical protein
MTHSFSPSRRVELLLNTLLDERHARRALLGELIDELEASNQEAARVARSLQQSLEEPPIDGDVYRKRILRISDLALRSPDSAKPGPRSVGR